MFFRLGDGPLKTTFIYFLKDPTDPMKGYVGKSNNPAQRFAYHLQALEICYRTNWIRSLIAAGKKPVLEILDEVPEEYWQQLEVAYIEFFRELGYVLVNGTPGGDGGPVMRGAANHNYGKKFSLETRSKLSEAHKGQPGHWLGKKRPLETAAKISLTKRGRKTGKSSQFFGVCFIKNKKSPWRAFLRIGPKKYVSSGQFINEVDAASAYDSLLKRHRPEDTNLNFSI